MSHVTHDCDTSCFRFSRYSCDSVSSSASALTKQVLLSRLMRAITRLVWSSSLLRCLTAYGMTTERPGQPSQATSIALEYLFDLLPNHFSFSGAGLTAGVSYFSVPVEQTFLSLNGHRRLGRDNYKLLCPSRLVSSCLLSPVWIAHKPSSVVRSLLLHWDGCLSQGKLLLLAHGTRLDRSFYFSLSCIFSSVLLQRFFGFIRGRSSVSQDPERNIVSEKLSIRSLDIENRCVFHHFLLLSLSFRNQARSSSWIFQYRSLRAAFVLSVCECRAVRLLVGLPVERRCNLWSVQI